MPPVGLLARIEAKPEHAEEVAELLLAALPMAVEEVDTRTWFAFRESETVFGIFDTFDDAQGREYHLQGRIAAALMEAVPRLLAAPPDIRYVDLLAAALP
ncbi:antibiotic biosynthesis monooxygenase [Kitasatospora sp. NPDC085879]|jgi:quinol monooxygenase YgiN|uniref:putative quinol monooxygenase n=1 Tax=Kitasatospora sp. NPDC085879 TaxID=3154769 RepID=UPI00344917DD